MTDEHEDCGREEFPRLNQYKVINRNRHELLFVLEFNKKPLVHSVYNNKNIIIINQWMRIERNEDI